MLVAAAVVVAVVVAGFWASITSEHTSCTAGFESREAAERAAERARSADFDVDVEPPSGARRATSLRSHQVAVTLSDEETGDDAAAFREAVQRIADEEGAIGHNAACSEISQSD